MIGLLSFTWLGDPTDPPPGIDQDDVAGALLLATVGIIAFSLSARSLARARPRPRLRLSANVIPRAWVLIAISCVSIAGTVVGLAVGSVGYGITERSEDLLAASQFFTQLTLIGSLVVLITALAHFGSADRPFGWLLVALVGAQILAGFLSWVQERGSAPCTPDDACVYRLRWQSSMAFDSASWYLRPYSCSFQRTVFTVAPTSRKEIRRLFGKAQSETLLCMVRSVSDLSTMLH